MKTILLKGAMLAAGLALSACAANEPTFGQRLQTQGADMAQIGGDWSEGADEVAEGGRLIARGQDSLREGREDIARGESLTRDGRSKMAEAEIRHQREAALNRSDRPYPGPVGEGPS